MSQDGRYRQDRVKVNELRLLLLTGIGIKTNGWVSTHTSRSEDTRPN